MSLILISQCPYLFFPSENTRCDMSNQMVGNVLINGATLFSLVYAIIHGPDEYSAQHGTTTDIPVELITTTDNSSVSSTQLLFSRWCQRSQSRQRSAVDDVSGLFVETINNHNKLTNDHDRWSSIRWSWIIQKPFTVCSTCTQRVVTGQGGKS